jgi:hypothetical protein
MILRTERHEDAHTLRCRQIIGMSGSTWLQDFLSHRTWTSDIRPCNTSSEATGSHSSGAGQAGAAGA